MLFIILKGYIMKLKENLNGPLLLVIILILTGAVIAGTIFISFKTQYKNTAPYKTSIELRANSKELAIKEITNDTIILDNDLNNLQVSIWIYSNPKLLGTFNIENNTIGGLKEAFSNINISSGEHVLALVNNSNKVLGYIKIEINDSKELVSSINEEDNTLEEKEDIDEEEVEEKKEPQIIVETKEIIEEENIDYQVEEQTEINMARGLTEVIQDGVEGKKEITYKVRYENGKEISRNKISEEVIRNPITKIIKVGISDYNLNEENILTYISGEYCDLDGLNTEDEICNKVLGKYTIYKLGNNSKLICLGNECSESSINLNDYIDTKMYNNKFYIATYQDKELYFNILKEDSKVLTIEDCTSLGLACGNW